MQKSIHQSADHISKAIDALTEVRTILHETMDSPYFEGDPIAVRESYGEVSDMIDDLESSHQYITDINLDF